MPATPLTPVTPSGPPAPVPGPAALRAHAERVAGEHERQDRRWHRGFTRRRFLEGVGMVGVAALGSQLVSTKMSFAATTAPVNTLVVVFLHGGADGLRMLVPASSALGLDDLLAVRPDLVPGPADRLALPGAGGWALNGGFAPLLPYWNSGEFALVPAVASPGGTRSHFDAQRNLQAGAVDTSTSGWLDRVLTALGPGTTFRAMGLGAGTAPESYVGTEAKLVAGSLASFGVPSWKGLETRTAEAISALYRGIDGSVAQDVAQTVAAMATVPTFASTAPQNGAVYPAGTLGSTLKDVARTLRAEVGLQVCTVDVGGWDTHSAEAADLDRDTASLATALAAFLQDLGPARRSRVTVLVQTEFGRRVAQNGNKGTDHGMGSLLMLLGGGIRGGQVLGRWNGVRPAALDAGDVPGLNDPFAVMGEVAQKRLGLGSLAAVFPGPAPTPLGVTA